MGEATVPTGVAVSAPRIVGYHCLNSQYNGVIPLSSYIDPCPHDVPVWSDGHVGER